MGDDSSDDRSGGSSSATASRAKDTYRALGHLDLTRHVQQTETRPRGNGGFSSVFYGRYKSPSKVVNVAIKRMRVMLPDDNDREGHIAKTVAKELKIWSKLVNPNVLPLLGFVVDGDSFPALVAEWMDNGTILNYINANMQADILYLVRGIASGLAYLHQSKVVHADLKSDNILISPEGAPLLTDFGISRTLVVTHTFTGLSNLMGSVRWMATELVNPNGYSLDDSDAEDRTLVTELAVAQTEDTDIWAFGMVVYELLTMNHPYYGMSEVQAMFRIAAGKLPPAPKHMETRQACHRSLWELCKSCCENSPDDRPKIKRIVNDLNKQPFIHKNSRSQQRIIDRNGHAHVLNGVAEHRPASHRSYSSSSTAIERPENHSSSTGSASHETTTQPRVNQSTNYAPQECREDSRTRIGQPQPPYSRVGGEPSGLTRQESRRGQEYGANIAMAGYPTRPNPHPAPTGDYSSPREDASSGQSGRSTRPTQDYGTSISPPTSYSYSTPSLLLSGSPSNPGSRTHPAIGVDRTASIDRYRNPQPQVTPPQPHAAAPQPRHAQAGLPTMDRKASERRGESVPYTAQTRKTSSESVGKDRSYSSTHNPPNPLPITKRPSQNQGRAPAPAPMASAPSKGLDYYSPPNPAVRNPLAVDSNFHGERSFQTPQPMASRPSQTPERRQTFEHRTTANPEPNLSKLVSSSNPLDAGVSKESKRSVDANREPSGRMEETPPVMVDWPHKTGRSGRPSNEKSPSHPLPTTSPYPAPSLSHPTHPGRPINTTTKPHVATVVGRTKSTDSHGHPQPHLDPPGPSPTTTAIPMQERQASNLREASGNAHTRKTTTEDSGKDFRHNGAVSRPPQTTLVPPTLGQSPPSTSSETKTNSTSHTRPTPSSDYPPVSASQSPAVANGVDGTHGGGGGCCCIIC